MSSPKPEDDRKRTCNYNYREKYDSIRYNRIKRREAIMKKVVSISFLIILIVLPSILHAQENPGDVWCVIPEGVDVGDHFTFEIHVNTGNQRLASY
jgi:hypothetical protein